VILHTSSRAIVGDRAKAFETNVRGYCSNRSAHLASNFARAFLVVSFSFSLASIEIDQLAASLVVWQRVARKLLSTNWALSGRAASAARQLARNTSFVFRCNARDNRGYCGQSFFGWSDKY